MVPDLAETQRAISAHVAEHRRRTGKRIKEEALTEGILGLLSNFSSNYCFLYTALLVISVGGLLKISKLGDIGDVPL